MKKTLFNKILAGLEDGIAFIKGEPDRAKIVYPKVEYGKAVRANVYIKNRTVAPLQLFWANCTIDGIMHSIKFEFIDLPRLNGWSLSDISFVSDGPYKKMTKGFVFEISEGPKNIGKVEVI